MKRKATAIVTAMATLVVFSSVAHAQTLIREPVKTFPSTSYLSPSILTTIMRPDLKITDFIYQKRSYCGEDEYLIKVYAKVTNSGGTYGVRDGTRVSVNLTPMSTYTTVRNDPNITGQTTVAMPGPGESVWVKVFESNWLPKIYNYILSKTLFELRVDKYNLIAESNESNNTKFVLYSDVDEWCW